MADCFIIITVNPYIELTLFRLMHITFLFIFGTYLERFVISDNVPVVLHCPNSQILTRVDSKLAHRWD